MEHLLNEKVAGSKRKRLPEQPNSSPQRSIPLFSKELQMNRIPQSQTTPATPPSPADTFATSTDAVGDQPIPALSAVSGLEDNNNAPQSPTPGPRRLQKYKYPEGFTPIFGKLHPKIPQFQTPPPPPTDTTATSIGLVADQPIPAASTVNGPQVTANNPPQPLAPAPSVPVRRRRRNGTALDPNSVGVDLSITSGLWESNLWFPGVHIPGSSKIGLQIFLGSYLTKQEAQDVHDRAALKLFEIKRVVPGLNFHASRHAQFMEEYRDWNFRDFVWQFRRSTAGFTKGTSSMKGVSVRTNCKGSLFEAKIARTYSQEVGKVHYSLGKFESEEEAGRAYDRALLFLHHEESEGEKLDVITNFRPSSYSESEILRAGKANNILKDSDPSRSA